MSLDLFVVRHAIATPRELAALDADRPLTDRGRERFAREVLGMQRLGWRLDRVLHSPWRRAAETAELLERLARDPLESTDLLAQPPTEALLGALGEGSVAVVGHEPWLSELVAWLATGAPALRLSFEMKKGAVAHLEGAPVPGGMLLRALLPPRVLRALA